MKSARSAWYFAADRLASRPRTTTAPWLVQTLQAHLFRLRGTKVTSNVENSGLTIVAASRPLSNRINFNPAVRPLSSPIWVKEIPRQSPVWAIESKGDAGREMGLAAL
jgi:hypothetical protein